MNDAHGISYFCLVCRPLEIHEYIGFCLDCRGECLAGGTTILGGKLTSEVSDANPTLITPAGYARTGVYGKKKPDPQYNINRDIDAMGTSTSSTSS